MLGLHYVALRKESVDRNVQNPQEVACRLSSLSARRAWIEIDFTDIWWVGDYVALRKESVDRNGKNSLYDILRNGRSPQGERG